MNKKAIYLFIALLLPSSVFVFLKLTGKNQFDIPIYYKSGIDSLSSLCYRDYSKPYFIHDSVLSQLNWVEKESSLVTLGAINGGEMKRLNDIFSKTEYAIYTINDSTSSRQIQLNVSRFNHWKNCVFVAKEYINIVLVDKQKRIRGYYNVGTREEMDRLIVEMKILLKKY